MRLRIFQSDKGDCLLLTGDDHRRILIDGGLKGAYREHVAPWLDRYIRRRGKALDIVYVSHIDADHIEGVLELFDNLVAWAVHDHQLANGNPTHPEPEVPRPPRPGEIWHNAFHEQLGRNAGAIAEAYAAVAEILAAHDDPDIQAFAMRRENLATSERQAILLSRRVGRNQLNVPLNPPAGGRLVFARDGQGPIPVGGMSVTVVGPFEEDLVALRKRWNAWLRKNRDTLARIRRSSARDEETLTSAVAAPALSLAAAAAQLGRRDNVTVPNLASLMLLVEEDSKSVLLTGDGHADDVLKGLRATGKLREGEGLHVNVLKVPHHGSEHNTTPAFARTVTANHYVFCGNGAHHNPDLRVVDTFLKSRLGPAAERSPNPEAPRRFTFWFNSAPDVPGRSSYRAHLGDVHALVERWRAGSGEQLRVRWLDRSSTEFRV